jgi:acetyl esterase
MLKYLFIMILGLNSLFGQSIWTMDPLEVRKQINQSALAIEAEQVAVYEIKDLEVTERQIPVRVYYPNENDHLPLIYLIHGGGWVAGNLDTHDNLARYLCHESQMVVVSVGYSNSPESKFPQPLEQCYNVLLWTLEHAKELHIDGSRIALVGDSAGGNMAAALTLMARARNKPAICLQILINPATDLTCNGTLEQQGDARDTLRWFVRQYVTDPEDVYNNLASPLRAPDLSQLPPALIILAEYDDLRADGQQYANRLLKAGVSTKTYTQYGVDHLGKEAARASKRAQESLRVAVWQLRLMLGRG